MHHTKAILSLALMQMLATCIVAQRADTTAAVVNFQLQDNQATFNSKLRPLRQIAGAPEAFYSYFWEFGDGHFSFEEQPAHIYKDTGIYAVRLYATNNYDDGKPPPTRPRPVHVNSRANYTGNKGPSFFKQGGTIEMRVNRMPKADEDMVLIMGYQNENNSAPVNGSLVLFYNEREFRQNNFDLTEERIYNNEKKISINSIAANFRDEEIMEKFFITAVLVDLDLSLLKFVDLLINFAERLGIPCAKIKAFCDVRNTL